MGHTPPPWVTKGSLFFITICTQPRNENQLCCDEVASAIFETTAIRHERGRWYCRLMVLMPDHLHALIAFPPTARMDQTIFSFKRFVSRNTPVVWQRDFFDHRLRKEESLQLKGHYIRQNPVRAGLIEKAEKWPFVWTPPQ